MSINSLTSYNPLSINGLDTVNINGNPFDPSTLVPYSGSTTAVDLNSQNLTTTGAVNAGTLTSSGLTTAQNITIGNSITSGIIAFGAPSGGYVPWVIYTDSIGNIRIRTRVALPNFGLTLDSSGNIITSGSLTATTAQFSAITSSTPSLSLGIDSSGNLVSSPYLITENNTWTGTNTLNNTLTTGPTYTTSLNNIFSTANNSSGQTASNLTTAGMPSTAPVGSVLSGAYQLTAGASTGVMGMWLGSYVHQSGNTSNFSFTAMRGSQALSLSIYQYNTAGTSSVSIGDSVYAITTSSQTITGSFTANKYASYTGSIIFFFQALAVAQNVQFSAFSMTNGSTNINGKQLISCASAGALTVGNIGGGYSAQGAGTIGQFTINTNYAGQVAFVINAGDAPNSSTYYWKMESLIQGSGQVGYKASVYNNGTTKSAMYYGYNGWVAIGADVPSANFQVQNTYSTGSNNAVFSVRNTSTNSETIVYQQVSAGAYNSICVAGDTAFINMDAQNGVNATAGLVLGCWNRSPAIRIGTTNTKINGTLILAPNDETVTIGVGNQATSIIGSLYVYNKIASENGYNAYDKRALKAKDITASAVNFYFGTMTNNNDGSNGYSDCIGLNGWNDGSGGNTNVLMVNKNGFGIRQYQQAFGTNSAMTDYRDCCMKGSGDSAYTKFGPNATWGAYLAVGACPSQINSVTAQVIATNSNLHLDGGYSHDIYYGYYAYANGTPNAHRFWGLDITFNQGLPQQTDIYSYPVVLCGAQLCRSQALVKEVYTNNGVAWTAGVNMTYAFYRYNGYSSVNIKGKLSYYVGSAGWAYPYVRIASQATGSAWYYSLQAYTNNTYNHLTFPFDIIFNSTLTTQNGWFDLFFYNSSACISDSGDQLWVNVTVLPASGF